MHLEQFERMKKKTIEKIDDGLRTLRSEKNAKQQARQPIKVIGHRASTSFK